MKPNVVLIHWHDLGQMLPCYGYDYIKAPYLSQLADEGAIFTNNIAVAPICMPSRVGIYAGKMPHSCSVYGQLPFAEDTKCMAQYFNESGYNTVHFGTNNIINTPEWEGFKLVYDKNSNQVKEEQVCKFIDEYNEGNPFFITIGYGNVHRPFGNEYDEEIIDKIDIPDYLPVNQTVCKDIAALAKQVESTDRKVGKIFTAIKKANLEKNTLIIFTTDHGLAVARAKHTLYDSGLKTTLIIKYPQLIKAGSRYDNLLSNVDLLPTISDITGIEVGEDIIGHSFYNLLIDEEYQERDAAYSEHTWGRRSGLWMYTPRRSIRTKKYKLILNFTNLPNYIDSDWIGRFMNQQDIVEEFYGISSPREELYDLEKDPMELVNLSDDSEYAAIRDRLRKKLIDFLKETEDPIINGIIQNPQGYQDVSQWVMDEEGNYRLKQFNRPITDEVQFE